MDQELIIKYQFNQKKNQPERIFKGMSDFASSYRQLSLLIAESVDLVTDFDFSMTKIEEGSIKAFFSNPIQSIGGHIGERIYSHGNKILNEIMEDDIETEEEVDKLAARIEEQLINPSINQLKPPHIDRLRLALILETLSNANQAVNDDESVSVATTDDPVPRYLNPRWRFTGKSSDMFRGEKQTIRAKSHLLVKIAVNEGSAAWTFKDAKTKDTFSARICDENWLKSYQNGLIPAVGPKHIIYAETEIVYQESSSGSNKHEIVSAKLTKIISVHKQTSFQNGINDE